MRMFEVSLGVDVEPDCPPYLATQYRGIEEGLPRLLGLLADRRIQATFFCTGAVAERYPAAIRGIVAQGHELGCHGYAHRRFDRMDYAAARQDIALASRVLREFGVPVTSFRAPNLQLPDRYLPLLAEHGFERDSSQGKYKLAYALAQRSAALLRFPASTTSSVLRLPAWIRDPVLRSFAEPVVLFVHPWEFVDLTRERLRADCRFRTGEPALRALAEVIDVYRMRGASFLPLNQLTPRNNNASA